VIGIFDTIVVLVGHWYISTCAWYIFDNIIQHIDTLLPKYGKMVLHLSTTHMTDILRYPAISVIRKKIVFFYDVSTHLENRDSQNLNRNESF
jgi:hypothetical protein